MHTRQERIIRMFRIEVQKRYMSLFALLFFAAALLVAAKKADASGGIRIREEEIQIPGLTRAYDFFLIADTHISLCDERDESLMEKARARRLAFEQESKKTAVRTFQNLITQANQRNADLAIFAGDITDSAMQASVAFVEKQVQRLRMPFLYVTGNHDFEYGNAYFSKQAYQEYYPRLRGLTGTREQYVVREYEDLVVLGINDKNNQFSKRAVEALLPYLKGKKPVIVILHVPLQPQYADSALEQQANAVWGLSKQGRCRVLLGETACKPNGATKKLLDAIFAADSPVAAVFAGHIHFYNRGMLNDRTEQIVTGAGYYGDAVRIRVRPK